MRNSKMKVRGKISKFGVLAMSTSLSLSCVLNVCSSNSITVKAAFEDDMMSYLLVSEDNSVAADGLQQFTIAEQNAVKGVSDKSTPLEVGLSSNTFTTTLDDYNGVVVAKTLEARRLAEEKRKKEEEERKRKAEEERQRKIAEALEKAYRIAEETGENVPNYDENCHSWIKTYMGYQAVTNKRSYQYALLNSEYAYTDPDTGLRMFDDSGDCSDPRYCIALGSFYTTTIGQKVDLLLYDGTIVPCVLGDAKADIHTNDTNQYGMLNGDVAEFIIDDTVYYTKYDSSGTVNWVDGLAGSIYSVVLLDEYACY